MKQPKRQANTRPRRRWIIIGPGIILALILSLQVWINARSKYSEPPIIERQVIDSSAGEKLTPTPEISFILERKEKLSLSDRQIRDLHRLEIEWGTKSSPLDADLKSAVSRFNAYMQKPKGRASMQDIQSHAGEVSELSRQISSQRKIYWEKALQVLNPNQRKTIEQEAVQDTTRSLDR